MGKVMFCMACALGLSAFLPAAGAGAQEDAIIARVTAAYGGEKLMNLRSIRGRDQKARPNTSATGSPAVTHIDQEFVLDIQNGRAISEVLPESDPDRAMYGTNFASILAGQGDYATARTEFQRALASAEDTLGHEHRELIAILAWCRHFGRARAGDVACGDRHRKAQLEATLLVVERLLILDGDLDGL